MVKSRTPRKSKIKYSGTPEQKQQLAEVTQAVNNAASYVKHWKLKELAAMAESKNSVPTCIPFGRHGLLIGKHVVKPSVNAGEWELLEYNKDYSRFFNSQTSAVAFALCKQTGRIRLAEEIIAKEHKLSELQNKMDNFRYNLANAYKKKDYWRIDLFSILSENMGMRLEDAKNQLHKTLNLTKYFNIWEPKP